LDVDDCLNVDYNANVDITGNFNLGAFSNRNWVDRNRAENASVNACEVQISNVDSHLNRSDVANLHFVSEFLHAVRGARDKFAAIPSIGKDTADRNFDIAFDGR
jgi:hypothetical protein